MTREDFEELPASDLEALRPFAMRRTYRQGTTLFRQGDPPEEIMILEHGEIELVRKTGGERLVVQILHAGSSVDHLALILESPHRCSAVALSEATVLRLRLDTISALEELFPEIAFRWLRLVAHALDGAYERLQQFAGKSAAEQVALLLIDEAAARDEPTLELTQDELAATLALSRQTVSRVLHDLVREEVVRPERGRIVILDLDKLRAHVPH
jgi:CRP/FNR family transcriptional regulator, cyclic AMP receptor protein